MRVKYRTKRTSKPIPVLLDQALRDRIDEVSLKMGEPKSTVMRIAMRIGLEGLEKSFVATDPKTLASLLTQAEKPSVPPEEVELPPADHASSESEADTDRKIAEAVEADATKKTKGRRK